MSIIELDTLFYAPKTSSLQPQRASRSIRGKVFLNGCPLTLGKCVFRACVTKYPYPPPLNFTRLLSRRFFYVCNHVINSLCLSALRNHASPRWRSRKKTIFPKNGAKSAQFFSVFSVWRTESSPALKCVAFRINALKTRLTRHVS